MAQRAQSGRRTSLSRRRVLQAAVDLADRHGLEALTMRRLAQDLQVEAMSLYHHVPSKDAIISGAIEVVIGEILGAVADVGTPVTAEWRSTLRARILAARRVLVRHPWAPAAITTRGVMVPEIVDYFDGVLGVLRTGGFSYDLAHQALHALGSRALGFAQELFEPTTAAAAAGPALESMIEQMAERYPHIVGMMSAIAHDDPSGLGWCDDQAEFEFGLDLILDGLEARRAGA